MILARPAVLKFDHRQRSPDEGAVLLNAAERRYELIAGLVGYLDEMLQTGNVEHSLNKLLAQPMFSIAPGYAYANDSPQLVKENRL